MNTIGEQLSEITSSLIDIEGNCYTFDDTDDVDEYTMHTAIITTLRDMHGIKPTRGALLNFVDIATERARAMQKRRHVIS
jgi:hypothetical protein